MKTVIRSGLRLAAAGALLGLWTTIVPAQTPLAQPLPAPPKPAQPALEADAEPLPASDAKPANPAASEADELSLSQEQLAAKYKRFEEVLLRMAELSEATDPDRAALLRKAVAQSKDRLIQVQFERLVELLKGDRLSLAVTNQGGLRQDLGQLLDLLLSEQRDKRLADEQQRIKEQLEKINQLINKQRQLQGQTASGGDMQGLSQDQARLAGEAGKLSGEMQKPGEDPAGKTDGQSKEGQDAGKPSDPGKSQPDGAKNTGSRGQDEKGAGQDGKGAQNKEGQKPDSQDQPGEPNSEHEKQPDGKQPQDGDKPPQKGGPPQEPGDPQEGDSPQGGKQTPGSQQQGQSQQGGGQQQQQDDSQQNDPQDGQQPSSQEQSEEPPARKRVEAAQQRMEQAKQKLEKARREGALEDQQAAIDELQQAKAELEEILRQLREEEIERRLAMLEARFRKMLEMQIDVYEGTKRLDRVPKEDRGRNDEIEAGRMSREESKILVEVDDCALILREDGSAVAFPEAVEQMREDMNQIVLRLGQAKVDETTQQVEEDVIAALEEMIEALKKAQKEQQDRQQQQQQPQQGESSDPPLIDKMAELKMIRSLQLRINRRTQQYAEMVEGEVGQADKPDLVDALRRLGERQQRLYQTTRDIVVGKNK